jgi:hypothetical protein
MVLTDRLGDPSPGVGLSRMRLGMRRWGGGGERGSGDRAGDVEFSVVEEARCWTLEDLSEGDNI